MNRPTVNGRLRWDERDYTTLSPQQRSVLERMLRENPFDFRIECFYFRLNLGLRTYSIVEPATPDRGE